MPEPEDLRAGLDRLAGHVHPPDRASVVDGVARRRAQRRRRRRALVTGLSAVTVVALVGAGIALPRLGGDDGPDEGVVAAPEDVTLPAQPQRALALAGDDEGVWVLTAPPPDAPDDAATVVRVDTYSGEVTATGEVSGPADLIAVSDDAVWVAGSGADVVSRLDRDSLEVTAQVPIRLDEPWCIRCLEDVDPHAFEPTDLVVAGGRAWLASPHGVVARIDPATNELDATVQVTPGFDRQLAADEGSLYVTQDDHLTEIDLDTTEVVRPWPLADLVDLAGEPAFGGFTRRVIRVTDVSMAGGLLWLATDDPVANPSNSTIVVDPAGWVRVADFGPTASLGVGAGEPWFVNEGQLWRRPGGEPVPGERRLLEGPYATLDRLDPATEAGGSFWYLGDERDLVPVPPDIDQGPRTIPIVVGTSTVGQETLLDPAVEERLVDDPPGPFAGAYAYVLEPAGIQLVHNTEFANCLLLLGQDVCDPRIADHELHVEAIPHETGAVVAALLPEGVDLVVLDTIEVDRWQQVDDGRWFAVLTMDWAPSAADHLVGYAEDGTVVFDEPLG